MPESFVFVDDNPAEREIIKAQVPGVAVPEIGEVENYIRAIDHAGYFEVINLSADDAKRNEMYKANAQRAALEAAFSDYGQYLDSLEMTGVIKNFDEQEQSVQPYDQEVFKGGNRGSSRL